MTWIGGQRARTWVSGRALDFPRKLWVKSVENIYRYSWEIPIFENVLGKCYWMILQKRRENSKLYKILKHRKPQSNMWHLKNSGKIQISLFARPLFLHYSKRRENSKFLKISKTPKITSDQQVTQKKAGNSNSLFSKIT